MRKTNVAALDTLADTQIVEQCLEKIEARCRNTLKQVGYPTDPDTFAHDDRGNPRMQAFLVAMLAPGCRPRGVVVNAVVTNTTRRYRTLSLDGLAGRAHEDLSIASLTNRPATAERLGDA